MQNKANFHRAKMNVNFYLTKDYERNDIFAVPENKANSNPIKANLLNAQMNVSSILTKDYRKKDDFAVRKNKPNSNPISEKPKMNVNLYVIEDYENVPLRRCGENKPKQTQFQTLHLQKTRFFPPKPLLLPMLNAAS